MTSTYNEIDAYAARWIGNLIAAGHVAPGAVDTRSITELTTEDVRHARQAHFFAGIAVWSAALRAAGWDDAIPCWTGSCPCQPFSVAGRGKGTVDERHLWPEWFRLIRECRPPVIFGEQVASPAGLGWLDAVFADLEGAGYACAAADLCAGRWRSARQTAAVLRGHHRGAKDGSKSVRSLEGAQAEAKRRGWNNDLCTAAMGTWLASGKPRSGSRTSTAETGSLNPALSRWLMGLSVAWDDCAPTAMQSSGRKHKPSSSP